MKSNCDRDVERFRSKQKGDMDQRTKHEMNEERKFLRSLKDKRDTDMKRFLGQQKNDYRATKNLYKTVSCMLHFLVWR